MPRTIEAIKTEFEGTIYRSRTEARWAVFLSHLGLTFDYEPERLLLSTGKGYLPDFFVKDFGAYVEVKPDSDKVVTEECAKALQLSADRPELAVWIAMGVPSSTAGNVLPLKEWPRDEPIESILASSENRYRILDDRRDDRIYWLHAEFVTGGFRHSYMVGGPGTSTDHERLPLLHRLVASGYEAATAARFDSK